MACSLAALRAYVAGAPLVGALGLLQLVLSHHLSWRPPGWLGAAPITAQTFAVCVNALVLERSSAAAALGLYLGAGLLATRVPALAPFGPKFSRATTGFVVGFVPAAWWLCWPPRFVTWRRRLLDSGAVLNDSADSTYGGRLDCVPYWRLASAGSCWSQEIFPGPGVRGLPGATSSGSWILWMRMWCSPPSPPRSHPR